MNGAEAINGTESPSVQKRMKCKIYSKQITKNPRGNPPGVAALGTDHSITVTGSRGGRRRRRRSEEINR